MVESEEHESPDGLLTLAVETLPDGDTAIGFRGFSWHTHADVLASISGRPEPDAVRSFVDDILADRATIAALTIDGRVHDAWVTDDPVGDRKYQQPTESIAFRFWSGRPLADAD